jgi:hypothetical protein
MKFTENYVQIISSCLGNSWLYSSAIKKGTSDETITINNKHVTSSSTLITLTFDSDPNTIDNLYVYSRSLGSPFDIRVNNTRELTTNEVKVASI